MEHIEEAGVHSGDATMSLPAQTLSKDVISKIVEDLQQDRERTSYQGTYEPPISGQGQ